MPEQPSLILEHSAELSALFARVLEDEDLPAVSISSDEELMPEVRRLSPALIVLDVVPAGDETFRLLDALRADQAGRAVPVVVITTSPQVAAEALASYNVTASLVKPFDLGPFIDAARTAAGMATMHAEIPETPGGFMDQVERILSEQARGIVFGWVQRLEDESPWGDRADLDLAALIDHAPLVVETLNVRLHYESPHDFFERHPEALLRARAHAHLRQRQGVPYAAALREYALLRGEIWRTLHERVWGDLPAEEFFRVERAINGTLDAIISATAAELAGEEPLSPEDLSETEAV